MDEAQLLNAKILVVDDADANLRLLEELLSNEGFTQVVSTTDPTKSIELFNVLKPDLVLLDLMMPEMDGYEVLNRIRCQRLSH